MGVPEMEAYLNDLTTRKQIGRLDRAEEKFFKKFVKALACLTENPRHNSLASHEIEALTRKHGLRIFQSYIENQMPAAGRIFWAYGPERGDITILSPSSRARKIRSGGGCERIRVSSMPSRKGGKN